MLRSPCSDWLPCESFLSGWVGLRGGGAGLVSIVGQSDMRGLVTPGRGFVAGGALVYERAWPCGLPIGASRVPADFAARRLPRERVAGLCF